MRAETKSMNDLNSIGLKLTVSIRIEFDGIVRNREWIVRSIPENLKTSDLKRAVTQKLMDTTIHPIRKSRQIHPKVPVFRVIDDYNSILRFFEKKMSLVSLKEIVWFSVESTLEYFHL